MSRDLIHSVELYSPHMQKYPELGTGQSWNVNKALIYIVNTWLSSIPDHFSGFMSGNTSSLAISGLQPEDATDYYCCCNPDSYVYLSDPSSWGSETQNLPYTHRLF